MINVFFSIIIPTHNRAELLKKALDSLLAQTYQNFEVLVCDDGSSDNTKDIVNEFSNKLNIHYIWEENWGGPARPRNNGIRAAKGEWICFLDSDDYWYPLKLESCLLYLDESDLVYHHLDIVGDENFSYHDKLICRKIDSKFTFKDLLLNWNGIANSSVLVRKSILNNSIFFDEDKKLIGVEDFDMWLQIAQKTNRFTLIPEILGAYYVGGVSLTSNIETVIQKENYLLGKYKNYLLDLEFNKIQSHILYIAGTKLLNCDERKKANYYLLKVVKNNCSLIQRFKALIFYIFGKSTFIIIKFFLFKKNGFHNSSML